MIYTEKYRIRWHDTDAWREMFPSEVLAYMQETAHHQFRTHAVTLDELRDTQGVGFILSRVAVDFLAPVHAHDAIAVETNTCPPHGYTFPRAFRMKRGDEVVARAMTHWALMRVCDRQLLRPEALPFSLGDEPEIETTMPLRFHPPREAVFETVGERRVVYADLDYNMHMNNTKYPNMVCDFLPVADLRVTGISLCYVREAAFGDLLTVERAAAEEGVFYLRTRKNGEICLEAMVRTEPR